MSDSWGSKIDDMKRWVKENATDAEGKIDADAVMSRVRETVSGIDREVDTEAVVARVKETVAKAEGAIDTDKLRQWVDDVDAEKLKGWAAEAKERAAKLRQDV